MSLRSKVDKYLVFIPLNLKNSSKLWRKAGWYFESSEQQKLDSSSPNIDFNQENCLCSFELNNLVVSFNKDPETSTWDADSFVNPLVLTSALKKSYEISLLVVSQKWPVLVYGPAGATKTALISKLARDSGNQVFSIHIDDQIDGKTLMTSKHTISRMFHCTAVAALSPTRFEARHVWKESCAYAISLLASIPAVHSTDLSCNGKHPTFDTALTAVRTTWKRPLVTTICVYAVVLVYVLLQRTLVVAAAGGLGPVAVALVGLGEEVYLMAVLSLGVVVSVMEEQWGGMRLGAGENGSKSRAESSDAILAVRSMLPGVIHG
ncbi:hypothetical protein AAG906_020732 [Vitis piasezkii]